MPVLIGFKLQREILPMFRSSTCASLTLILGLIATPAFAQQAKPEQLQPNAAAGPAIPAPQTGGAVGMMPGSGGTPRTIINNTFNPTGPTGTGTFSPTAEFIVCVNDGGVRGEHSTRMTGMMSARASHVEGRIAFLKTELKITDAQLPLWNAVADAMRDHAKSMATMSGEMMGTLPERVAALEKVTAARLNAVHKLKTAIDPLYAALGDEQKKVADELTADMGDDTMGGKTQGQGRKGGGARHD